MTTPTLVATDPTTEMPLAAPPDVPPEPEPARMGWFQRLGRETGYVVVTFPVAIAAFVVVVTGISVGAGLLITLIGFPILAITGYAARGFAHFERAQIRDVLERDAPSPRYRRARSDDSIVRRIFVPLGDAQTWLDLVHGLVGFVTSIVAFVVVVTWWACTLGGLSFPIWGWALPSGSQNRDLPEMLGLRIRLRGQGRLLRGVRRHLRDRAAVRGAGDGGGPLGAGPGPAVGSGRGAAAGRVPRGGP